MLMFQKVKNRYKEPSNQNGKKTNPSKRVYLEEGKIAKGPLSTPGNILLRNENADWRSKIFLLFSVL